MRLAVVLGRVTADSRTYLVRALGTALLRTLFCHDGTQEQVQEQTEQPGVSQVRSPLKVSLTANRCITTYGTNKFAKALPGYLQPQTTGF